MNTSGEALPSLTDICVSGVSLTQIPGHTRSSAGFTPRAAPAKSQAYTSPSGACTTRTFSSYTNRNQNVKLLQSPEEKENIPSHCLNSFAKSTWTNLRFPLSLKQGSVTVCDLGTHKAIFQAWVLSWKWCQDFLKYYYYDTFLTDLNVGEAALATETVFTKGLTQRLTSSRKVTNGSVVWQAIPGSLIVLDKCCREGSSF